MSDARILVTGATGFIGVPLVRRLRAAGLLVHTASRSTGDGTLAHPADLGSARRAAALVEGVGPTTIVHLAGGVRATASELYAVNAITLVNVMRAATRLPTPPVVIVLGSAAEYGEPPEGVARESSPLRPVSDYGRAKVAASTLAEAIASLHDVPLAILRPFNIVSPSLPTATALGNLRHQLLGQRGARRIIRCGRLDVVRDYVPLPFVVDALVVVVGMESPPRVLNVCSGRGIELRTILDSMASRLHVEVDVKVVPELAAIPAASRVIGDATALAELGLSCEPTAASLADILLGED